MKLQDFLFATMIVGLISFGGGKAFIPAYNQIYIQQYSFINIQQLQEYIGYSCTFPGPISPMITALVGFLHWGFLGLLLGLIALTIPSLFIVYMAYLFLQKWQDNFIFKFIQIYLNGVILALLSFIVLEFFKPYFIQSNILVSGYLCIIILFILITFSITVVRYTKKLFLFNLGLLLSNILLAIFYWSSWTQSFQNLVLYSTFSLISLIGLIRLKIHPVILMLILGSISIFLWNL